MYDSLPKGMTYWTKETFWFTLLMNMMCPYHVFSGYAGCETQTA